jgi:hypothetical protein
MKYTLDTPKIIMFRDKKDIPNTAQILRDVLDQSLEIERLGFSQSKGWVSVLYTIRDLPSDDQIRQALIAEGITDIIHEKWGMQ